MQRKSLIGFQHQIDNTLLNVLNFNKKYKYKKYTSIQCTNLKII